METKEEIIEWIMIRPDGSERYLHIGKNEVNSKELDFLSNNSLIIFEIYFSPQFNAYLRFYGYTPLRLNFEKIGDTSKHIYIDNNQSFVFLEELEKTTIDVYDKEEFVTFSFQKKIKKPEINKDIVEKNKRIKWINDNIEYEDLKKEENEYGNKSLYSKDYFNYSKKNLKKDEEQNDKSDIMSDFSKDKNGESSNQLKEKNESIEQKEISKNSENSSSKKSKDLDEKNNEEINNIQNEKEENLIENNEKEDISEVKVQNDNELKKEEIKDKEMMDIEDIKDNEIKTESKKFITPEKSEKSAKSEKESETSKKIIDNNKNKNLEPDIKEEKELKILEKEQYNEPKNKSEEIKEKEKDYSEEKDKTKILNYDKILDNFVLFNSEAESEEKESSSDNEEEEEEEISEKYQKEFIKSSQENNKKDKLANSLITKCTICLDQITNPATLKPCEHQFCKDCIEKWLKKSSACPDCKKNAKKLYFFSEKNKKYMGKKIKRKKYKAEKQGYEDWFLNCDKTCLICGKEDNTAYLLVCDSCNFRICHTFCVGLDSIPDTEWHCPECEAKEKGKVFSLSKSNLKKFQEKEKKLLKVKQSEVKERTVWSGSAQSSWDSIQI